MFFKQAVYPTDLSTSFLQPLHSRDYIGRGNGSISCQDVCQKRAKQQSFISMLLLHWLSSLQAGAGMGPF